MYHGNINERQARELHMCKERGGKGKTAATRTEPATSRSSLHLCSGKPRPISRYNIMTCRSKKIDLNKFKEDL